MYITYIKRDDGFGAQFQNILEALIYAENNGYEYVHTPIKKMEHNYNNDPSFIDSIEELMNIRQHYKIIDRDISSENVLKINLRGLYDHFESNIDTYLRTESMNRYRSIFWSNKNKNIFDNYHKHVSVHIRRPNIHDSRVDGSDTPDSYYLDVMSNISKKYRSANLMFHIYSQGNPGHFKKYIDTFDKVQLHINEPVPDTFIGLVASDILVTSRSSFSYVAALLHEGEVYYCPFWHKNASHWNIVK
jgi:hypothetical protein